MEISIHAPRTGSDGRAFALPFMRHSFQSTLPARGATNVGMSVLFTSINFNPRSPHGERRVKHTLEVEVAQISIHAPRTGSDLLRLYRRRHSALFQSTLPARGATIAGDDTLRRECHFNPRSPHGERHPDKKKPAPAKKFQSTLPARGATFSRHGIPRYGRISIHAPRTGSDRMFDGETYKTFAISIHAPRTGSDCAK